MGLFPYSKEIDAALNQIAPLAQKIKLVILVGIILQILTLFLLCLIFLAITALVICVIPELSNERDVLVTPPIKWLTQRWITSKNHQRDRQPKSRRDGDVPAADMKQ